MPQQGSPDMPGCQAATRSVAHAHAHRTSNTKLYGCSARFKIFIMARLKMSDVGLVYLSVGCMCNVCVVGVVQVRGGVYRVIFLI